MRTFILIASLVLVSAAAHAGPSMQMASNDAPAAQSSDVKSEPAPQQAVGQDVKQDTVKQDIAKPVKVSARKHEDHEAKARRIAAKYGVYW